MLRIVTALLFILSSTTVLADVKSDRKEITDMRDKILTRLYSEEPKSKKKIANAAGYATFSNIGVNVLFISAGGGSGVVRNNETGKDTFMNMGSGGIGLGLGVKDFNIVFVFKTQDAIETFIEDGWDFSGQADAAAKSGDKGDERSAAYTVVEGVDIYQMTENGLAIQATLQGTKYWQDGDLN